LQSLILNKSVVVLVGSGGVGKTTIAAAAGLQAARMGRRVLVLTIDPARRLANALGLSSFGNEVREVALPDAAAGGSFHAVMLDTRATFDDLIARMAPDEQTRRRIMANRIYKVVSDNFAGSQEYMATEKLYDLHMSGEYDLVVLDTPPVKNALDFIEAPGRLSRFVDRHIVKWFMTPYDEKRIFGRVLVGTSGVIFRLLAVIFGREFLEELSEFFQIFREFMDGFHERHEAVVQLFAHPDTAFVVACAPERASMDTAFFFADELQARQIPFGGFVVNRVHRCTADGLPVGALLGELAGRLSADLAPHTAASLLARLEMAHQRLRSVAEAEAPRLARIRQVPASFVCELPLLDQPIRALDGLLDMNRHLFGGGGGA